jgi:hypothetical protein
MEYMIKFVLAIIQVLSYQRVLSTVVYIEVLNIMFQNTNREFFSSNQCQNYLYF